VCEPFLLVPKKGPLGDKASDAGIPVFVERLVHWVPGAWVKGSRKGYLKHNFRFFGSLAQRSLAIRRLIEEQKIGLVYTNTVTCVEGAIAAKMARRPHIWHIRESIPGNSELVSLLPFDGHCSVISALSKAVVFCSKALADNYPRLADKANVVHNGFRFPPLRDRRLARAENDGEARSGPRSETRGDRRSAAPPEGPSYLPRSRGPGRRTGGERRLPRCRHRLRAVHRLGTGRIAELGLDTRVKLLGWRDDVVDLLAGIDVLVISSEQESFGRTMVEALAMETPVVSTRCGGPEEVWSTAIPVSWSGQGTLPHSPMRS
jgi:hypothetical protein